MAANVAVWTEIANETELREIIGEPHRAVLDKERTALSEMDRVWLAASPFCVVATSDVDGNCDVSPKGDPAGKLVHVVDDSTLAIPERPGNRRVDGYRNVLTNPHVGLVFVVPGRGETLRVNGRARLVRDAPFMDDLAVKGKRPLMAMVVDIDTIFLHCPKAFLRSALWKPESWTPDEVASQLRSAEKREHPHTATQEVESDDARYAEHLY